MRLQLSPRSARRAAVAAACVFSAILVLLILQEYRTVVGNPEPWKGAALSSRPARGPGGAVSPTSNPEEPQPSFTPPASPTDEYRENLRKELAGRLDPLRVTWDPFTDPRGFPPKYKQHREWLREVLRSLGPEAIPVLEEILREEVDWRLRREILDGIAAIGTEQATRALQTYFLELYRNPDNALECDDTIKAMAKVNEESSYESIRFLIRNEQAKTFKERLVWALGEHDMRGDATPLFVELMMTDPDPGVRNKSAQAMKKVRDPQALPVLEDAVRTERAVYVQQTMLGAMGDTGDPAAIPFLREIATSWDSSDLRLTAVDSIGRIGGEGAIQILEVVVQNEKDPGVRRHAESMLASLRRG